jgi:hypothetical protein
MPALTKEAIQASLDMMGESVNAPEWGGIIFVKPMTGAERDAFEAEITEAKDRKFVNIRARLAVRTICDENGVRLFADADAESLGGKSSAVLDRVFEVAQRLSGIGAKEVKELSGN